MNNVKALAQCLSKQQIKYQLDEPMNQHTTFQIGGNCDIMIWPSSVEQMQQTVAACVEHHVPYFALGKGSNLLVSDSGCRLAAISTKQLHRIKWLGDDQIYCESGVSLMELCLFAQQHGLCGLEFAYGIPGSVGGAVYMNAGAYGGEMCDVVVQSEHICRDGQRQVYQANQLDFSYRHSAYSDTDCCIVSAVFQLSAGDPSQIKLRMDELLGRRKEKQPLEYPSAGSTFKRPKGGYASSLIEQSGLKGTSIGGAMVSDKHSGFIINKDHASCKDVEALIAHVQQVVEQKTGFVLEPEVKKIG